MEGTIRIPKQKKKAEKERFSRRRMEAKTAKTFSNTVFIVFLKPVDGLYEKFKVSFSGDRMNFAKAEILCRQMHGQNIKVIRYGYGDL